MAADRTWSISAEWVLTGNGRSIRRGVLRLRGGRIEAVGPVGEVPPARRHRSLGEVALLPGLINAHTHLELSHLRGELPAGRPLVQWLFGVGRRMPRGKDVDAAVADGAAEALARGTTALADTCHNGSAWRTLKQTPLRSLCLAEVMGVGPAARGAIPRLEKAIRGLRSTTRMKFGLAPHAPYSTGKDIYLRVLGMARRRRWIVATHLAETEGERQYMLRGSGKLFEFLAHLGLINSSVGIHRVKPIEFARRVGLLDLPAILAHVNYLDDEEMDILSRGRASVVYCPGSSEFFRHTGHRYAEMLARGINVALGTDSLASNSSLDMLREMRSVRANGKVDNQTILRMATLNGAAALGWSDRIGSLEPRKQADWIVVELPPDSPEPLEVILTNNARVLEVVIAGKTVHTAAEA